MTRRQHSLSNTIQESMDSLIAEVTAPAALLALLLEIKLRKARVRLTTAERARLRSTSKAYWETKDQNILAQAIERKRHIKIRIGKRDIALLERIVTKADEGTITDTIKILAKKFEPEVHTWATSYAAWHEAAAFEFRGRLARRWRTPLQRFATFRHLAAHVGELSAEHFRKKRLFKTSRLANALALLHARACLIAAEVESLIHAGFADGAMARWRTLHEVAVTAAFLSERGETTAERYLAHFAPANLKAAKQYQVYRRKLGEKPLGRRFLAQLRKQVAVLLAKYGKDFREEYGWAQAVFPGRRVTFATIEESVKLDFMRPYYKLASEQVHASSRGVVLRSGIRDLMPWRAEMLIGPTNYGFADAGQRAAQSLLLATVSLLTVEPTADTNVMCLILTKWIGPLRESFVRAQRKVR